MKSYPVLFRINVVNEAMLIGVDLASKEFNLSQTTIYRWIRQEKGTARPFKRKTFIESKKSEFLKKMSKRAGVRHERQLQIKADQEKLSEPSFQWDFKE